MRWVVLVQVTMNVPLVRVKLVRAVKWNPYSGLAFVSNMEYQSHCCDLVAPWVGCRSCHWNIVVQLDQKRCQTSQPLGQDWADSLVPIICVPGVLPGIRPLGRLGGDHGNSGQGCLWGIWRGSLSSWLVFASIFWCQLTHNSAPDKLACKQLLPLSVLVVQLFAQLVDEIFSSANWLVLTATASDVIVCKHCPCFPLLMCTCISFCLTVYLVLLYANKHPCSDICHIMAPYK